VHYSIKLTYSKDAHNILGLILLYISCKPYRDNKLKKLLTSLSILPSKDKSRKLAMAVFR